jgi:hypothetical protein
MFFWFCGTSLVSVWFVFKDPAIDHRVVVLGALLPDLIDAPFGGARIAHAVVFPVAVLMLVMLATRGRRQLRRRLVMLAVGLFLHLVFDGGLGNARVFWWPFSGLSLPDATLPVVDRGLVNIVLELVGLGMCAWFWRRFGLSERSRREVFVRTGRLDRSVV